MRGSVRAWIPATVVAVLLAIGVGAAAYFTLGRGAGGSASPTPSVDLHSSAAVIAAIRHYYAVIDEARATGNAALIDSVAEIGSTANNNLKQFLADQAARNRRGVAKSESFENWSVTLNGDRAQVEYTNWSSGHDVDATTSKPVEADATTTKGRYSAELIATGGRWLVIGATLVQDNVP